MAEIKPISTLNSVSAIADADQIVLNVKDTGPSWTTSIISPTDFGAQIGSYLTIPYLPTDEGGTITGNVEIQGQLNVVTSGNTLALQIGDDSNSGGSSYFYNSGQIKISGTGNTPWLDLAPAVSQTWDTGQTHDIVFQITNYDIPVFAVHEQGYTTIRGSVVIGDTTEGGPSNTPGYLQLTGSDGADDQSSDKAFTVEYGGTSVVEFDYTGKATFESVTINGDITPAGDIIPANNGTQDLGADQKRWKDVYVKDGVDFTDKRTGTDAILSIRDGQIILTNSTDEVTTAVDLGGTTPDPGHLRNVELDGTGRYAVGPSTLANTNGLITREFINTPGQFFVINDIDGGAFTGGNRQCFGLVRETIVDGSDLSGRTEGLFTGGNSGGWSTGPFWYYTGGYPYIWTSYSIAAQTPQGSGETYAGTFSNQNSQRAWWGACTTLGLGKKYRVGIADGTNSDATGANFSNRLIHQLYVHQEIIDDATVLATLPANVATYGAGWYTCWATNGDYENMGQFPGDSTGYAASRQAGVDKGYRFRWSTFGNTTLNQLPYLLGVPTINDQIAAATGLSYYLVYEPTAADLAAANVTLASGTTSAENTFYTSKQVALLQFQQPYTDWETSTDNVFNINHTELGAVQSSPLFVTYPLTTSEEIIEAGLSVQGIESIRATVSEIILQAVIGYYMVRQLDATDRATVRTQFAEITNAANTGQLQQVHDLVSDLTPDPLYPQELIDALLDRTAFYLKNYPVF